MWYDIDLYGTDELHDHCDSEYNDPTRAIDRVETYLEGAYNRMSGHSASVTAYSDRVYAPTENYGHSFTTIHPCGTHSVQFDGLLDWWQTNANCQNMDKAGFANILVTAGKSDSGSPWIGGGVTDQDNFAVVITGIKSAEVPSTYQDYGMGGEYKAVRTAHHELGHMMMGNVDNSHDWGETHKHGTSDHYMTPMYVQGTYNACSSYQSTPGDRGWEQKWSDCCEGEW